MDAMTFAFRLHMMFTIVAFVGTLVLTAVSLNANAQERLTSIPGVVIECNPGPCLSPVQVITAMQAWQMKHDPKEDALLVDIRGRAEAYYTGALSGIDAQVPFLEPPAGFQWNASVHEPVLEFRTDFVADVDEALRAAHLRHTDPVVLMDPSDERATVAALLLQEYGYSQVYVVRDGLPWTGRVHARGSATQPRQY